MRSRRRWRCRCCSRRRRPDVSRKLRAASRGNRRDSRQTDASRVLNSIAKAVTAYRDPVRIGFIKLADGGLTDNFAVSTLVISRLALGTPYAPMTERDAVSRPLCVADRPRAESTAGAHVAERADRSAARDRSVRASTCGSATLTSSRGCSRHRAPSSARKGCLTPGARSPGWKPRNCR